MYSFLPTCFGNPGSHHSLMMAPGSAESCVKETVYRLCLVHENLVRWVEFDIMHGTYNINPLAPEFSFKC
jgi:hypothetical protein